MSGDSKKPDLVWINEADGFTLEQPDSIRAALDRHTNHCYERAEIQALFDCLNVMRAENDTLRAALDHIAAWDEGEEVGPHFDEPNAARVARKALGPTEGER